MNILLSWTGKDREPRTFRGGEVVSGAHLQLLGTRPFAGTFDRHFLFTVPQRMADAEALVAEIARGIPSLRRCRARATGRDWASTDVKALPPIGLETPQLAQMSRAFCASV